MNPPRKLSRHTMAACAAFLICVASSTLADWPIFHGDPALSGLAHETVTPPLALRWSFKTGGAVKSSPVIRDGKVFIGSSDGKVYALELASGQKQWEFQTGDAIEAPPLALSNTVLPLKTRRDRCTRDDWSPPRRSGCSA